MKIAIEVDTGHGGAGINKRLNWQYLDKLVFWFITRKLKRKADLSMLGDSKDE